ncbi:Calcium-dependent secretion activator 1 [Schistosoma japonicum]|nr:Calcium-dependent secretion activator 1 [Schistosoma japonicum]
MLDSSSSEDEENTGGFANYGTKPTITNVAASRKYPMQSDIARPTSRPQADNISEGQRILQPKSVRTNLSDVNASYGPQNSTSRHIDSVDRSQSPHSKQNYASGPKDQVSSSQRGRPPHQWKNGTFSRSGYNQEPQHQLTCSSSMQEDDEISVSAMSLNTQLPQQQSQAQFSKHNTMERYASGTHGSSSFSVNSTNSAPNAESTECHQEKRESRNPSLASQSQDLSTANDPSVTLRDPAALEQEKLEREERERRKALQLYVFVMRCIAYPFYSKPPTDLIRRYLKITKQQLNTFKERFNAFLSGELDVVGDEAFTNAVQSYYEGFLRSDRVASMVRGGGCSMHDFREVFRLNSEHRVQFLPEIEGLNKANVVSAWMVKFDQICRGGAGPSTVLQKLQVPQPELVMTKEQLYELFQTTLGVKKYEHQILYNALQLDNVDEQAAQVRRELDGQLQTVEEISRTRQFPRLVVKDMESLYADELRKMVGELMLRLESVPVTRGSSSFQKFKKVNRSQNPSTNSPSLSYNKEYNDEINELNSKNKLGIQLNFSVEIIIGQVKNLKYLPSNKMVYCTMEVEGGSRLQTDLAEAGKPVWGTQGDFSTNQPLPAVKIKLYAESSGLLSLDSGKELGRVILNPTCTGNRQPEWHKLHTSKNVPDDLQIQLTLRMEKPNNLKHCGYLYALGRTAFRKWRRRYICLIQVSQYTFIMASYKERKSDPTEIMQLEGFTVDFCDVQSDLAVTGGKYFLNLVKEGDSVMFATDDENERQLWIQAIYRATGQTHKPVAPSKNTGSNNSNLQNVNLISGNKSLSLATSTLSRGNTSSIGNRTQGDVDRARKHGLDEFVSIQPWKVNHAELFSLLQSKSLDYRMKDSYVSLGWFSPSQMFILDEYCARYGVRGCHRHLCYLSDLLDRAEQGIIIDPAIVHYSYAFCCCHVFGNIQDTNIRTVLVEERQMFMGIRQRLYALLEKQITEFRYYFPFGRPEGALKLTLGLLERVLMKDTGAPASAEEVREVIRRCLEQAALVNYARISEYAAIESGRDKGGEHSQASNKTLADLIHLAELCIEVLRQNEEHHAEAFSWFQDLLTEHAELFWNFFSVDMVAVLEIMPPDCWDSFPLFQLLNDYLSSEVSLKSGKFHQQLTQIYAPLVVRYVDLMEASIAQSISGGLDNGQLSSQNGSQNPDSSTGATSTSTSFAASALETVGALGNVGSLVSAAAAGAANAANVAGRTGGLMAAATAAANAATQAATNPASIGTTACIPVTSSELLWKLEALQNFIRELHWPDIVFAEHLDNRLKMMAADMIDAAAQRNLNCFDSWLKRSSKSTDFILPNECCNMINTVIELKASILKLCTKDTKGEDMHEYQNQTETNLERVQRKMAILLNDKMGKILEGSLMKLARYDVNTLLSSVLSLTKPTDEIGKAYVEFLRVNLEQMRQKVSDELYILSIMETWYMTQTRVINDWLIERKGNALSSYQFTCLSTIIKKMYADFELQGISPDALDTMAYKTIMQRLQMEETAQAVRPDTGSSPTRSILGTITGSLSGIPKPGFFSKI